jgi:phenylacetate-CoA ligase
MRSAKLAALLEHARSTVPFYRDWFAGRGLAAADLRDPAIFASLPILTKAQLRELGAALLSERYPTHRRTQELTSGSSGQPFATHFDREYVLAKNLRFLRGLMSSGYRPGHKLMLITERPTTRLSTVRRWLYCPLEAPAEEHAAQLVAFRPDVLYGCMTPLYLLARHLSEGSLPFTPPRAVISTAEMLGSSTRAVLERTFRAPVIDFYGMTEMGLVAWKPGSAMRYSLMQDGVLVERAPVSSAPDWSRLVMTNLDLWAMPMIRYDTGDMGAFGSDGGTPGKDDLLRIEGRSVDCIVAADRRLISPFRLTSALQDVPGLRRFRIRQTRLEEIEVDLETATEASTSGEVVVRLSALLGPTVRIKTQAVAQIRVGPSGKFRVVESALARSN